MKTLVDPDAQMYRYRCDGPLCNPNPHKYNPDIDYTLFPMRIMHCHRDVDIEIRGWSHIISKHGVLHICPDCTIATINIVREQVEKIMVKLIPLDKASLEIANLLFDLDLYDD